MRSHRTVFLLFLRHIVLPLLALIGIVAAAEVGCFLAFGGDPAALTLEAALDRASWSLTLVAALGLAACFGLLLGATLGRGRVRTQYTLCRLSLSHRAVVLWQAAANALAVLLYLLAQALICLLLCWLYVQRGGTLGPQALFLAFWRVELFHAVLPLEHTARWVANGLTVAAIGLLLACATDRVREGRRGFAAVLCAPTIVAFFRTTDMTDPGYLLYLVAIAALAYSVSYLWSIPFWTDDDDPAPQEGAGS